MERTSYLQWASHIPELSESQQRDLLKRIGIKPGTNGRYNPDKDWFIISIKRALIRHNLASKATLFRIESLRGWYVYTKDSVSVRAELEAILPKRSKGYLKRNLSNLAAECLIQYCLKNIKFNNASTILMQTHQTINAIEHFYPGYIKSGNFIAVLKATEDNPIRLD